MISQRCAICNCDSDGNIQPQDADMLCSKHMQLGMVSELMKRGAWSEFDGKPWRKAPNHRMMMLTRDPQEAERRHAWQAVVLTACNVKRVLWDG